MSAPRDVIVDLFADPTCPWCHVGWAALKSAAAAKPEIVLRLIWRPFLLNPATPPEGLDRRAFWAERMAQDPERWTAAREALAVAAREAGAKLAPEGPSRIPNAVDAHRFMIWAAGQDKAAAAADALFNAYWVDGRDIGDRAVLGALADEIGLDAAIVGELLESGADREAVLALHDAALDLGVTGVPVMTFNRKVMRLGADSSKSYSEALDLACA